jgi:hypothetical protein
MAADHKFWARLVCMHGRCLAAPLPIAVLTERLPFHGLVEAKRNGGLKTESCSLFAQLAFEEILRGHALFEIIPTFTAPGCGFGPVEEREDKEDLLEQRTPETREKRGHSAGVDKA